MTTSISVGDRLRSVRRDNALAFFLFLLIAQSAHIVEHIVQLTQLFVLHVDKAHAHGIVGNLDIEWVHFAWNLLVFVATAGLVIRYRSNVWLWIAFALATWHQIEHVYVLSVYLYTGLAGSPGFLSKGGLIAGGLPIVRPVLHTLYNVIEIIPLTIGFIREVRLSPALAKTPTGLRKAEAKA